MSIKQLSKVSAAAILTVLLWGPSTTALGGQTQTAAVSPVTKQWIADLKSIDPVKRTQAADQLGSLRVRPAVPDLVAVLSDKDPRVREASAFALGEIADQDAANHLSRLLAGDTDASVRASSAFALGMLEDTKSVSALLDSLDDSSAEVRSAALVALGLMRDQDDVEDIEEMLNDPSLDVRYDAVWALGQIGDPDSAERLRSTLVNVDLVQFTPVAREAFREAVQAALDLIQDNASVRGNSTKSRSRKGSGTAPSSKDLPTGSHPASLKLSVMPARTEPAIAANVGGTVELRVLISADGRLVRAYVLKRLKYGLDRRAVEAALLFKFFPRTHDGLPQTEWYDLNISFPSK